MKVERKKLVKLLEDNDVAVSKKGKPLSNEKLLDALKDSIDDMADDEGNFEDELAAMLSAAIDEEDDIEITGDDPSVPKKAEKPAAKSKKSAKPAKKGKSKPPVDEEEDDEDEEEEEDDEDEKPAKKKKSSKTEKPAAKGDKKSKKEKPAKKTTVRDKWNSSPDSMAGRINAIFFANKKPITIDDVHTALGDDSITRQRVRDHIRRLHHDEILLLDGKGRYSANKEWSKPSKDEE